MRNVISGIPGAKNISDDIIIFGKSQIDHDRALDNTCQRLFENGLTLNLEKCELNKDKEVFFGVTFSKEGISTDPEKVTTLKDISPPISVAELRSLLSMTNYSSRFIPRYATITEPSRRLTRQNTEYWYSWGTEQDAAFEKLKQELSSETVMTYFNPKLYINIYVDAIPVGNNVTRKQDWLLQVES